MSRKRISKPAWWKNTYFAIAAILLVIGIIGLPFVAGENAIRDPGQVREPGLVWIYFASALVMVVNGYLSHIQAVKAYHEAVEDEPAPREAVDEVVSN